MTYQLGRNIEIIKFGTEKKNSMEDTSGLLESWHKTRLTNQPNKLNLSKENVSPVALFQL